MENLHMTRAEFIAQLDTLKRRGQPVLYGYFALLLLFDSAVIFWTFRRYPLASVQGARDGRVVWYLSAFLVVVGAFALYVRALRRVAARYAPKCPVCGQPASWKDRAYILSSSRCRKCGSLFLSDSQTEK
jgi:hypothetical protein